MIFTYSAKLWIRTICAALLLLTLIYCVVHDPPRGAPAEIWQMSGRDKVKLGATERAVISDLLHAGRALAPCDTSFDHSPNCPANFANNPHRTAVLNYLGMHFRNWMYTDSLLQCRVLAPMSEEEVDDYLVNAKFTMHSFFWLVGWRTMIEVVFWTWFGVLSRLLYGVFRTTRAYMVARSANPDYDPDPENRGFDPGEIHNHLAQVVFAPFVSLILTLGFQYFFSEEATDVVETSTGIVITSYLLGFYSSRAMGLLQRIRDVLLPVDATRDNPLPPPLPAPARPSPPASAPAGPADLLIKLVLAPEVSATLTAEDDLEELHNQLGAATVVLLPAAGGDKVTAQPQGDEQESLFVAKRLMSGAYTVQAELHASTGVNLSGNVHVDTASATSVEIAMQRDTNDG